MVSQDSPKGLDRPMGKEELKVPQAVKPNRLCPAEPCRGEGNHFVLCAHHRICSGLERLGALEAAEERVARDKLSGCDRKEGDLCEGRP